MKMAVKKTRAAAPRTAPSAPSAPTPAVDAGPAPDGPDTAVQAALTANPGATAAVIAAAAGVSRAAASRALAAMAADGRAARAGNATWNPVSPAEETAGDAGTLDGDIPEPAAAASVPSAVPAQDAAGPSSGQSACQRWWRCRPASDRRTTGLG